MEDNRKKSEFEKICWNKLGPHLLFHSEKGQKQDLGLGLQKKGNHERDGEKKPPKYLRKSKKRRIPYITVPDQGEASERGWYTKTKPEVKKPFRA